MAAAPSVLVFDVNETLIDIESIAPVFERILGDRAGRCGSGSIQLVMYSMTATPCGGVYADFFTLGQGILRMLATTTLVEITGPTSMR